MLFVSMYFPFDRFLRCPKCKTEYHNDAIDYKFSAASLTFSAKCPKCKHSGSFEHDDRRSPDKSKVEIVRWNPKQIRLRVHPVSNDTTYYWELPSDFVTKIRKGDHFFLRTTPWAILKCFKQSASSTSMPLFEFSDDAIYHFKESSLAGLPIVGWGIPPILPNFKLAYYIQVLRRFDEAIAHDFIVPFRTIYPDYGPSANQDPLAMDSASSFVGQMQSMVQAHRNDPTLVQVAPFKVGYQMLGGEVKASHLKTRSHRHSTSC